MSGEVLPVLESGPDPAAECLEILRGTHPEMVRLRARVQGLLSECSRLMEEKRSAEASLRAVTEMGSNLSDELRDERRGRLRALAAEIREINRSNGWNVPQPEDWSEATHNRVPTFLALIHSEVSEALEAFRGGDRENFTEELADVLIRVLDTAGGMGLDLDAAVAAKLAKNRTRGHRHGGKRV